MQDIDHEWINKKGIAEFVVKCVCKKCNNEWMSEIETAAQEVMPSMILGDLRVELGASQQEAIAKWLGLKAVLTQYAITPKKIETSWAKVYALEQKPPKEWHVRVGHYTGTSPVNMAKSAITYTALHRLSPVALRKPGLLFTITIGQFLGQVIAITDNWPMTINRQYFTQIWPHPLLRAEGLRVSDLDPQLWPPERGIDDSSLALCMKDSAEPRT